jgi:hypothetical protein
MNLTVESLGYEGINVSEQSVDSGAVWGCQRHAEMRKRKNAGTR